MHFAMVSPQARMHVRAESDNRLLVSEREGKVNRVGRSEAVGRQTSHAQREGRPRVPACLPACLPDWMDVKEARPIPYSPSIPSLGLHSSSV